MPIFRPAKDPASQAMGLVVLFVEMLDVTWLDIDFTWSLFTW